MLQAPTWLHLPPPPGPAGAAAGTVWTPQGPRERRGRVGEVHQLEGAACGASRLQQGPVLGTVGVRGGEVMPVTVVSPHEE